MSNLLILKLYFYYYINNIVIKFEDPLRNQKRMQTLLFNCELGTMPMKQIHTWNAI